MVLSKAALVFQLMTTPASTHILHFDWPDATEAMRRLSKRCQNVVENFVGVTVCGTHIVNSKTNGLVLLLKTILRH